jgi:polyhydroxyalkanoate synthesis regulator phasin
MTNTNGNFNPFDPTGMLKGMRDANMDAWSKMMIELVNTDAYAEATGAMLNTWLTTSGPFRKVMEDSMAKTLEQLNMPSRDDVTRMAERLTNLEMRLDDLDAKLDEALRPSQCGEK